MNDTSWSPPAGGWSMEPQPLITPATDSPKPTLTRTPRWIRAWNSGARKMARIEARQVARAEVIVNRAPAIIHRGKAPR